MGNGQAARTQIDSTTILGLGLAWEKTPLRTLTGQLRQLLLPPEAPVLMGTSSHLLEYLHEQTRADPLKPYITRLWLRDREITAFSGVWGIWTPARCRHDIWMLLGTLSRGHSMEVEMQSCDHGTMTGVLASEALPASRWDKEDSERFVSGPE